ncbi:MAG: GntR family transcriptional regulator [Nocardioidaceae bacterium]
MWFTVDPDSSVGLADQIASQIRGAVVSGRLKPADKLPPARELAAGLDVNMHTVLRAYAALRDEGLIELRRGRGAQVRATLNRDLVDLDLQIRSLLDAANRLGFTRTELLDHIETVST